MSDTLDLAAIKAAYKALCGYSVADKDGNEEPCNRPATGWRWYQDCDHEDALDVACDRHANEGGRRIAALTAERDALRAAVTDFAEHGLRADLNPTMDCRDVSALYAHLMRYLRRVDESTRERARAALTPDAES